MRIGRNDPCPCGSGKKHKKCCLNKAVHIHQERDSELDRLQHELLHHYKKKCGEEVTKKLTTALAKFAYQEENEQFVSTLYLMGMIFHEKMETLGGGGIAEEFTADKLRQLSDVGAVQTEIKKWPSAQAGFVTILRKPDYLSLEVEEAFTKEVKQIKLREAHPELAEGDVLFGFLLPYGAYFRYFLFYLNFRKEIGERFLGMLEQACKRKGYQDGTVFIRENYQDIISMLVHGDDPFQVNRLAWENPMHEIVADLFKVTIGDLGYPARAGETGAALWNLYCEENSPSFRKPQIYAAALHYFVDVHVPGLGLYTQKKLADVYEVNSASLSKAYRKLEEELLKQKDILADILEKHEYTSLAEG